MLFSLNDFDFDVQCFSTLDKLASFYESLPLRGKESSWSSIQDENSPLEYVVLPLRDSEVTHLQTTWGLALTRIYSRSVRAPFGSLYLDQKRKTIVVMSSTMPQMKEHDAKYTLTVQFLRTFFKDATSSTMGVFTNWIKESSGQQTYLTLELQTDLKQVCFEQLRMRTRLQKDVADLVPSFYYKMWIEGHHLHVVSKIHKVRYRGASYYFGPYELRINLLPDASSPDCGWLRVRNYNFLQDKNFPGRPRVLVACAGENTPYIHPHVGQTTSADGWSSCCLGNYETPCKEAYIQSDIKKILYLMHEFFSAVASNWYREIGLFKYCKSPEVFFVDRLRCQGKSTARPCSGCSPVVQDCKFHPGWYDYGADIEKFAQPTQEQPTPWLTERELSTTYITKFSEADFDVDGFDPEGFDSYGFNREGFNTEGFNKNGFDREGYNARGFDRHGFNRDGYNSDGYNMAGYNRRGLTRRGVYSEQHDVEGWGQTYLTGTTNDEEALF